MTLIAGLLLLIALACWTYGVLRFVHWVMARRDSRVDSAYRAARLVAVSRAEVIR